MGGGVPKRVIFITKSYALQYSNAADNAIPLLAARVQPLGVGAFNHANQAQRVWIEAVPRPTA